MKILNLLRYVTLAQWREHALRTLLTAVGLALGVAVIVSMRLVNGAVFASIRASVDDVAGRAVLSVTNGQAGVPEELLDRVRAVPGVRTAAALILDSGLVLDHPERGERLQVFGVDYLEDSKIRNYELDGGDGSELDDPITILSQPDSIFVTRRFAAEHALALGSPLHLQTTAGPQDLVVRGILKEAGPAQAFGGMLALMDIYAAQLAFGKGVAGVPGRFDQIDVVLDDAVPDDASIDAARSRIAAAVAGSATVSRPESRGDQMASLLGATKLGFAQAQALAFIVGVFLVFNTMSIAVVQRRREIGLLI
jgi:putative ABC transport system permease protein